MSEDHTEASVEAAMVQARDVLRSTANAIETLRSLLGGVLPVVAPSAAQATHTILEIVNARGRVEEALGNAAARLIEARAHLAVAQQALPPFLKLRASHQQAMMDLAAQRLAEKHADSGEKPS